MTQQDKRSKYLQILAASVASGLSVRDAAAIAGCTTSTGYSLSCSDAFKHEVRRIKDEAVGQAVSVLSTNATKASQALVMLLSSQDEKVVLAAAVKILSMLGPLQELHELRQDLADLKEQMNAPRLKVVL
jgi:hypothetical protein